MYYLTPMCCICLKRNTKSEKLGKINDTNLVLLENIALFPLDFEHLKLDIPLYICKKCNSFLVKIRQFQVSFATTITKLKSYVIQLRLGTNYVPSRFYDLSVPLNKTLSIKEARNEFIKANQPKIILKKLPTKIIPKQTKNQNKTINNRSGISEETVDISNFLVCELEELNNTGLVQEKYKNKATRQNKVTKTTENSNINSKSKPSNSKKSNNQLVKRLNDSETDKTLHDEIINQLFRDSPTEEIGEIPDIYQQTVTKPPENSRTDKIGPSKSVETIPDHSFEYVKKCKQIQTQPSDIRDRSQTTLPPSKTLVENIRNKLATILDSSKTSLPPPSERLSQLFEEKLLDKPLIPPHNIKQEDCDTIDSESSDIFRNVVIKNEEMPTIKQEEINL